MLETYLFVAATAAALRFLRHQASRPPLARIRPDMPAPTIGLRTADTRPATVKSTVTVSPTTPPAPSANDQKRAGDGDA
jgi:hypothetical protein